MGIGLTSESSLDATLGVRPDSSKTLTGGRDTGVEGRFAGVVRPDFTGSGLKALFGRLVSLVGVVSPERSECPRRLEPTLRSSSDKTGLVGRLRSMLSGIAGMLMYSSSGLLARGRGAGAGMGTGMTGGERMGGERIGGGSGIEEEGGLRMERIATGVVPRIGREVSRVRGRD